LALLLAGACADGGGAPILEPPISVRPAPPDLPASGCFDVEAADGLPLGFRAVGLDGHGLIGVRPDGERVRLHRFFRARGATPLTMEVAPSPDRLLAIAVREGPLGFEVEMVLAARDGVVLQRTWLSGGIPPAPWGGLARSGRGYLSWPLLVEPAGPVFAVFDAEGDLYELPPAALPVAAPDAAGRVAIQRPGVDDDDDDEADPVLQFFDLATREVTPLRFPATTWSAHGVDDRARYFFSSGGTWARGLEGPDGSVDVVELGVPATQTLALRGAEPRSIVFGDGRPQVLVDAEADRRVPLPADEAGVDARVRSSGPGDQGPWYLVSRGSAPVGRIDLGGETGEVERVDPVLPPEGAGPLEGRCRESNGIVDDGALALFLADDAAGRVWVEAPDTGSGWRALGRPFVDPDFVRMRFVDGRFAFFAGRDRGGDCAFPWSTSALASGDPDVLRGGHAQVGIVAGGTTWFRTFPLPADPETTGPQALPTSDLACVLFREADFLFDPAGSLGSDEASELVDVASGTSLVLDGLRSAAVFPR